MRLSICTKIKRFLLTLCLQRQKPLKRVSFSGYMKKRKDQVIELNVSFFKQFFRLRDELNEARSLGTGEFTEKAGYCLKLVYTYMMSCKWHDTRRNRDLMTYIELPDSKAAEKMGLSANTVRSMRSVASNKLFTILGADCFDIIRFGDVEAQWQLACRLSVLNRGYDDMLSFLPMKLKDALFGAIRCSGGEFTLKECARELKLIARYDLLALDNQLDKLDAEHLAYIADVLIGIDDPEKRNQMLSEIVMMSTSLSAGIIKQGS